METLLPPPPSPPESQTVTEHESATELKQDSDPTVENHPPSLTTVTNRKMMKKKKRVSKGKDEEVKDASSIGIPSSASSSSVQKGRSLVLRRRCSRCRFSVARRGDGGDLALPLGMSFAAVVAQVLERQDATCERMSADDLSAICTSAVRESLANVFGGKSDFFVRNFEKSFGSTLRTLRLINESSFPKGNCLSANQNVEVSNSDVDCTSNSDTNSFHSDTDLPSNATHNRFHSETDLPSIVTNNRLNTCEEVAENVTTNSVDQGIALHGDANQLACVTSRTGSSINQSMLSTLKKSFMEQVRSNNLKKLELGLTMRKLKLKETQLALNLDSNHLERSKLAVGASKASFKAEKFKNQLEDTRHAELQKKCIDCLVAGLFLMSLSLSYGAYVFSYERITEATTSCTPSLEETKAWWMPKPMASLNSGLHSLKCQVQVASRMLFGVLMILTVAYMLLQRSVTTKQTMPITFILLLLGFACGLAGKFCVDTLGGSGYHWLFYWEILCLLHYFSNAWTSALFFILHGPVNMSQGMKSGTMFPYWIRRLLFYCIILFCLPLLSGLMPFASPCTWKDHFKLLVHDLLSNTSD
ncbi:hypothetical protein SLEP1_g34755 [Rubroshorea leprosula]|uniref:Protein CPR-5 n=1 Tax=Rubroshorea leprosula TaxID=152421 RepID=A0AAV5KL11_9ROSI|nr:hypothetical protein SLEP1_g34755 [Rubroshorea leprosula]